MMGRETTTINNCIHWRIFILFILLILVSYSNSFLVPFHFDDFHNITLNSKLHIDNLLPKTIYEALIHNPAGSGMFYRPVSNLSLGINWYFGKSNVTGYHIFNIVVHILTAFFLYMTIVNLLKTPKLSSHYEKDKYFIAVLAACLWAVNPIQTQAVTYIVQRMAAMAAMFYIMGIFCYLEARFSDAWTKRSLWSLGVVISFLLAVGSKENAIMFPISLLLVEMVFFQNMASPEIRKKMMILGSVALLGVLVSGAWFFLSSGFINNILSGYENRTFTLTERVLTQPRIVLFYLSQIFYPIADRLSLDHDIVVSTGLFSPWTTFAAIFLNLGLISIAIWQIPKRPLLAFAILFFFINHIIESSVLALELIFEHRNYLPSFFLFLPIAAALKKAFDHYLKERHSNIMAGVLICFCIILMVMLGLGTYVRNMAWADGKTLWEDTIEKAPGRARAYQNLITSYYGKQNDSDTILKLSEKSMYLHDSTRNKAKLVSLANMAEVYSKHRNDHKKAIKLYEQILNIKPEKHDTRYRLVLAMLQLGQIDHATYHIDYLLSKNSASDIYLNLKTLMLLHQNDPESAWIYAKKAVSVAPEDEATLLNLGTAKMKMGEYVSAEHYLRRVSELFDRNITALLLLLENSVRSGNIQKAEQYAGHLLSHFNTAQILSSLGQANQTSLQWPLTPELIAPIISERLNNQSRKLRELAKIDGT
jgi:protein O-mannosyl-transferase